MQGDVLTFSQNKALYIALLLVGVLMSVGSFVGLQRVYKKVDG